MFRSLGVALTFFTPAIACGGEDALELCSLSTHPLRYYLARPAAPPPPRRAWPVLICLAGADADFPRHTQRFLAARGEQPVVLVVPWTFSSANAVTGQTRRRFAAVYDDELINQVGGGLIPDVRARLAWDEAGLLALIEELRRRSPVAPSIYLTGFSAGANLTYWMVLKHPDLLAGAAPVCGNFPFWSVGRGDAAEAERTIRVHAISGERDPLRPSRIGLPMPSSGVSLAGGVLVLLGGIFAGRGKWKRRTRIAFLLGVGVLTVGLVVGRWSGNQVQTAHAVQLLRELGYTDVEWTVQPGMGHEPAERQVLDWLAS